MVRLTIKSKWITLFGHVIEIIVYQLWYSSPVQSEIYNFFKDIFAAFARSYVKKTMNFIQPFHVTQRCLCLWSK